jgi:uncharacterized protein (TIGR02145 family)
MKKLLLPLLLFGFNILAQIPGAGVTDIDGNQYPSVIIGTQEWMAENLRTSQYANGQVIHTGLDPYLWNGLNNPVPLWCHFNNDNQLENVYGKLYNYWAVIHPSSLCPNGWRVPTAMDWSDLFVYLDGGVTNIYGWDQSQNNLGGRLKSTSSLWSAPNSGANNSTGFSALPGAFIPQSAFGSIGTSAVFWSSTENITTVNSAFLVYLKYDKDDIDFDSADPDSGASVRCLKNTTLVNIPEIKLEKGELVKILNLMGQETEFKPNTVLIYLYSDGTTERVFKTE